MHDYNADLQRLFPPYEKLKDIQERVIKNTVENDSTLCIMPTGEGKSLIYWMTALELGGICLVISPLTALIVEQVEKIRSYGYEVLEMYSGVPANKQLDALIKLANHEITPQFIFASPEKIATDGLFEYCLKQRAENLNLVVIDEVHCVSQWGMSFRPFYKRIPDFLNRIFSGDWCRILALTATLNPKELGDICDSFRIKRANLIMKDILMRGEIQLHVHQFINEEEKTEKFWDIINIHSDEKILVYVYRKYNKRGVEDLCKAAKEKGYAAAFFHGEMTAQEREKIIDEYKNDRVNIIFATNAFGMGIDIPDIRVVIHFMIPESVEQYYQEVGRAARDGHGANAYLLYSAKNIDVKRRYFIDGSFPAIDKLKEVYSKLAIKTGYMTLQYFEDDEIQQCLPFFMLCGAIEIAGKGFADLNFIKEISDEKLSHYYDSTKTKGYVRTLKKNNLIPEELSEAIYGAIVKGTVRVSKPPERWLILKVNATELDDSSLQIIINDIEEKRNYKHGLLNYLVKLLDDKLNSQQLHQEIARYLGTDRHQLKRIYETLDHHHVRSKSEVIICDLLYKENITYEYEERLLYEGGKFIEPDFTIKIGDKVYYWEHIGMLGQEDYDQRWSEKIEIYRNHFPGQLIKTYETGNLSNDAQREINKIKADVEKANRV